MSGIIIANVDVSLKHTIGSAKANIIKWISHNLEKQVLFFHSPQFSQTLKTLSE